MNRNNVWFTVLVILFGTGTVMFGWWTLPVIGFAWGGLTRPRFGGAWMAAVAAGASWALLLAWAATQGPVGQLARRVGAIFGVPAFLLIVAAPVLAALLAGSAAALSATARQVTLRRSEKGNIG